MENILKVERLTKRFGSLVALREVSLELRENEILGLIGPNGSGKTTLINIVSGVLKPDLGRVLLKGSEVTGKTPEQICALGLCRTFQIAQPFPNLTVEENVMIGALFGRKDGRVNMNEAPRWASKQIDFVGLQNKRNTFARNLAVVELKKLEVARALAADPEILLLDETFTGLNLAQSAEAMGRLRMLTANGMTILLVEHNMKIVVNICDRVAVLNQGEKIAEGLPQEVMSSEKVIKAYLGEEYG